MMSAAYQKHGIGVLSANTWCMIYGALWLAAAALVRGEPFIVEWSARYVGSVLWLTVFSTVIAFAAYLTLLGRIGAGRAAYSTVLVPVVALLISRVAEGYVWTWTAALGVIFVVAGNIIVLSRMGSAPKPIV
jgi:drug/metabolite transporter (DMT)-like permease